MTRTCSSTLGDNDYLESPRSFGRTGRGASAGRVAPGCAWAACSGTTTTRPAAGGYELKTLGMPGPYYTRRLGGGEVQLFFLDSNSVSSRQTAWLEQQLSDSTATWKIALFHHPPYTCGGHSGNTQVVRELGAALRAVRRPTRSLGARSQLPALRGAERRHVRRPRRWRRARSTRCAAVRARIRGESAPSYQHGFLYVSATDSQLDVSAVDMRGRTTDHVRLTP